MDFFSCSSLLFTSRRRTLRAYSVLRTLSWWLLSLTPCFEKIQHFIL
ncbi:hypothetical protein HanPSC8_Chr13g0586711 [Helianthus annuus]|nr:hypothetical protein HanPSC8_Chr13g0586711 [Helianthus annuus]